MWMSASGIQIAYLVQNKSELQFLLIIIICIIVIRLHIHWNMFIGNLNGVLSYVEIPFYRVVQE